MKKEEVQDLVFRLIEYMDNIADADYDYGSGSHTPNKEMIFLVELRQLAFELNKPTPNFPKGSNQ